MLQDEGKNWFVKNEVIFHLPEFRKQKKISCCNTCSVLSVEINHITARVYILPNFKTSAVNNLEIDTNELKVCDRIENIADKGEKNATYQYFSFFPQCFHRQSLVLCVKDLIFLKVCK